MSSFFCIEYCMFVDKSIYLLYHQKSLGPQIVYIGKSEQRKFEKKIKHLLYGFFLNIQLSTPMKLIVVTKVQVKKINLQK